MADDVKICSSDIIRCSGNVEAGLTVDINGACVVRCATIVIGQLLMVSGLASLVMAVGAQAPVPLLVGLTVPVGAGSAMTIPTITALLLGSVPAERAGTASGALNTSRQLGGAIAVAVFGALVAQREMFVSGMQVSLAIGALVLIASTLASLRLAGRSARA